MPYMWDTNICIYLIKNRSNTLIHRVQEFRTAEIGVFVVTIAELQYGVAKSQQKVHNQVALDIANLSMDTTVIYGQIRAALEQHGSPIGPLDTLIAAHALSLDVPLVTNNTRDFSRVEGLRVEDWTVT